MSKLVRLSREITSEYAGDPEFGEPVVRRHPNPPPQGGFFEETVYIVLPGKTYSVSDGHAEYLRQTWGWRVEIRDAP